jgi:hypothetical protein
MYNLCMHRLLTCQEDNDGHVTSFEVLLNEGDDASSADDSDADVTSGHARFRVSLHHRTLDTYLLVCVCMCVCVCLRVCVCVCVCVCALTWRREREAVACVRGSAVYSGASCCT